MDAGIFLTLGLILPLHILGVSPSSCCFPLP
jgi:hypothetical protein